MSDKPRQDEAVGPYGSVSEPGLSNTPKVAAAASSQLHASSSQACWLDACLSLAWKVLDDDEYLQSGASSRCFCLWLSRAPNQRNGQSSDCSMAVDFLLGAVYQHSSTAGYLLQWKGRSRGTNKLLAAPERKPKGGTKTPNAPQDQSESPGSNGDCVEQLLDVTSRQADTAWACVPRAY